MRATIAITDFILADQPFAIDRFGGHWPVDSYYDDDGDPVEREDATYALCGTDELGWIMVNLILLPPKELN